MYKLIKSKLSNSVTLPSSKSYLHRALILSIIQQDNEKTELITNESTYQDDVISTINLLESLGAIINIEKDRIIVKKTDNFKNNLNIFVKESGTTLRFALPLLAALNKKGIIKGEGRVLERPLAPLIKILESAGSRIEINKEYIFIDGKINENQEYEIDASISSQYISGMLLAMTNLNNVKLKLTKNIASSKYIELTKKILEEFGYKVFGDKTLEIKKVKKANKRIHIESDWSCAVSMFGLSLGGDFSIKNIFLDSVQPDKDILFIFEKFNAIKKMHSNSIEISLKDYDGIIEDIDQKPDIAPVLSSLLCFAKTKSILKNVSRLKDKESNRLEEIIKMLRSVDCKVEQLNNDLIINPIVKNEKLYNLEYNGQDHRMLMAYACLLLGLKNGSTLLIKNEKCVEKSYKNYYSDIKKLGYNMEIL